MDRHPIFINVVHHGQDRLQIDLHPHSYAHSYVESQQFDGHYWGTTGRRAGRRMEHFVSIGGVVCRFWCVQTRFPSAVGHFHYDEIMLDPKAGMYWGTGPMEMQGVRVGDVLVKVNGEDVSHLSSVDVLSTASKAIKENAAATKENGVDKGVELVFARHWQALDSHTGKEKPGHGFGLRGVKVHELYRWEYWHTGEQEDELELGFDDYAASAVATANASNSAAAAGEKIGGSLAPYVGQEHARVAGGVAAAVASGTVSLGMGLYNAVGSMGSLLSRPVGSDDDAGVSAAVQGGAWRGAGGVGGHSLALEGASHEKNSGWQMGVDYRGSSTLQARNWQQDDATKSTSTAASDASADAAGAQSAAVQSAVQSEASPPTSPHSKQMSVIEDKSEKSGPTSSNGNGNSNGAPSDVAGSASWRRWKAQAQAQERALWRCVQYVESLLDGKYALEKQKRKQHEHEQGTKVEKEKEKEKESVLHAWQVQQKNEFGVPQTRYLLLCSASFYRLTYDASHGKVLKYACSRLVDIQALLATPGGLVIFTKAKESTGMSWLGLSGKRGWCEEANVLANSTVALQHPVHGMYLEQEDHLHRRLDAQVQKKEKKEKKKKKNDDDDNDDDDDDDDDESKAAALAVATPSLAPASAPAEMAANTNLAWPSLPREVVRSRSASARCYYAVAPAAAVAYAARSTVAVPPPGTEQEQGKGKDGWADEAAAGALPGAGPGPGSAAAAAPVAASLVATTAETPTLDTPTTTAATATETATHVSADIGTDTSAGAVEAAGAGAGAVGTTGDTESPTAAPEAFSLVDAKSLAVHMHSAFYWALHKNLF